MNKNIIPVIVSLLLNSGDDNVATNELPTLPTESFDYANIVLPTHYTQNDFPAGFQFQQAASNLDNTPIDNPITNAGATLGRVLFYDKKLSANGTIACASCHVQEHGFSDPNTLSIGFEGGLTGRHSMGLANARFYSSGRFFWDERANSLEQQVLMPFQDPVEMGLSLAHLENIVSEQSYYSSLFEQAFGDVSVTSARIAKALAQFVRSLVSTSSKYDSSRSQVASPIIDFPGFTDQENLGKSLFFLPQDVRGGNTANCAGCHISEAFVGPVPLVPGGTTNATINGLDSQSVDDLGVFGTTGNSNDIGKFKAPSLSNIAIRPPYMHDGRFTNLNQVIDHYSTGIQNHPNLTSPLRGMDGEPIQFNFSGQEKDALIAFLGTLTDYSMLADEKFSDPFNQPNVTPENSATPNILLIIADDLGKDAISGYAEGTIKPSTPNLDALRSNGLVFANLWSYPTCTPTRASIISGKYGYRTGIKWAGDQIDESEYVLQRLIADRTNNKYASALVGKWHLSGLNTTINPESWGIDYYAGLISGEVDDYYDWPLTEDGVSSTNTDYITEEFTDLAVNWIQSQSKPWFMWLAYNAPHTPFHVPPGEMHSQGNLAPFVDGMNPIPYFMAAIEAMDYQIGQLLDNIPIDERDNTIVIFLGDNGSPNQVAQAPYSNNTSKGTLFQGGINVPMIISGAGLTRIGMDENLITTTDLFATIAEIAGLNLNQVNDSKSFKTLLTTNESLRSFQYSELDDGTTDAWSISNGQYKLIENSNGDKEMYDLSLDPYEQFDLLENTLTQIEELAKSELEQELGNIRNWE
ncbi:MAG: cytochrome c peroxidase [Pseudomonadota bacterium]